MMTISLISKQEEKEKEKICSYCGSKISSGDSFCLFCQTPSGKVETQDTDKLIEIQKVRKIVKELISLNKDIEKARMELMVKQEELEDIKLENARRLAMMSAETEINTDFIEAEIADRTKSLNAKEKYYHLLNKKARKIYPDYFIREKK